MRLLRLVAMVCAAACCSHAVAAGLSIARGLETTRFATDRRGESVFVSPDGHRYAVMLIRGDIARDGVDVTLLVGRLDRREAGVPRAVLRLFTQALSGGFAAYFGANQLVAPDSNPPVWLDDTTLGMLWEDTAGTRQILRVDVEHGTQSWLTASTTPVVRFSALTPDALLFDAAMPVDYDTARRREQAGYAVDDADALELLHGGVRGVWDWMRHETFLVTSHHAEPRPIEFLGGEAVSRYLPRITPVSSHDGGRVLIAHTLSDAQLPDEWARYTQPHFRDMWQARADPTSFYARQFQQLFVLDMRSATARPLWPVPVDGLGRTQTAWSPTDTEVVLVPTFLPLAQSDASALAGDAAAIVNVDTGQSTRLPVEPSLAASIAQLHWNGTDRIDADLSDGRRLAWTRQADGWDVHIYVSDAPAAPSVPVKVLQDLNEPPVLATIDAGGVPHVLLDPNPQLSQQLLGKVEWFKHADGAGGVWEGRLYYPLHYTAGQAYPLVVQTYAFAGPHEFSLYGHEAPALGPGRSAYIAQALSGHDMFVLHGPSRGESVTDVERTLDALEYQIRELVRRGLVDPARVGIMGFSASGWLTTYALSRHGFAYAAALTDDNKDGSYMQAALSSWEFAAGAAMMGAPPFGDGLLRWLRYSPAMNVESIHTPLLITRSSPVSPLAGWELFSRLRYLHKPVEYYVIPDVEHGAHELQNPRQLLALQQRALDWWRFWLRDESDPDPDKREQYQQWDLLRRQHEEDLARTAR